MFPVLVTLIMSIIELAELWSGLSIGLSREWVETTLMVLAPLVVWLSVLYPERVPWRRGG